MKEQEGIWVNQSLSTPYGEVIVSVRLDTAIDPEVMCQKLEKNSEVLRKRMSQLIDKLDALTNKTPQKVIDATMNELIENQKLHGHNMIEYQRWSEALRLKIQEEDNAQTTNDQSV